MPTLMLHAAQRPRGIQHQQAKRCQHYLGPLSPDRLAKLAEFPVWIFFLEHWAALVREEHLQQWESEHARQDTESGFI